MTRAEPHLPAIRDAVADVLESNKLYDFARRVRCGDQDGAIAMTAATLAVERVLEGLAK